MHVNVVSKPEFIELVYSKTKNFLQKIAIPEAFVVQGFYKPEEILDFRQSIFQLGIASEPSWHPLYDDCPDYHRLHDNYPNAYVKARMHAFYFHGWYQANKSKFQYFQEIFAIKNFLAGLPESEFLSNIPSQGYIARVNIHHYPRGGGYQAEHIDPIGKHAQIQTIIQASEIGKDFQKGGVYAREIPDSPQVYIDGHTKPGDLIVMSPAIPHGVDAIDPEVPYEWKINDGRWMVMPIVVSSDYPNPESSKPRQLTTST